MKPEPPERNDADTLRWTLRGGDQAGKSPRDESFVSEKIEQWLGLKINRDKTRIYEVKVSENGLDFLGYNFSLALTAHGPKRRYWRVAPSKKSVQRETAQLRAMISNRQQHIPVIELIEQLNRHLRGWKNYYGKWHCGAAMKRINWYVENRLRRHLRRRSQRPWRSVLWRSLSLHRRQSLASKPLSRRNSNSTWCETQGLTLHSPTFCRTRARARENRIRRSSGNYGRYGTWSAPQH
jgi:hypothetical protein